MHTTSSTLLVSSLLLFLSGCPSLPPSAPSAPAADDSPATPVPPVVASIPTQAIVAASMTVARSKHTATLLPDGRVVAIGGEEAATRVMTASVEVYDPAENTWYSSPPLPQARANHTATLLQDGRVLVVGGGKSNAIGLPSGLEVASTALLWDPATGETSETGSPGTARHGHIAVLLPSGRVLIAAGAGNESFIAPAQGNSNPQPFGNALASAELFDPDTQQFTPVGSMSNARFATASVLLADGRVLIAGGAQREPVAASLASCEVFDEATRRFSDVADLVAGRLFHSMVRGSDDRITVVAGKLANVTMLASVERADPAVASWQSIVEAPPARTLPELVADDAGGALLFGGLSCNAQGCSLPDAVERITPDGRVDVVATLTRPRAGGTSTVLSDGSILFIGGFSNQSLRDVDLLVP